MIYFFYYDYCNDISKCLVKSYNNKSTKSITLYLSMCHDLHLRITLYLSMCHDLHLHPVLMMNHTCWLETCWKNFSYVISTKKTILNILWITKAQNQESKP